MIKRIENWIDQTNREFQENRISCLKFKRDFEDYYSESFLSQAFFVVVDKLPKPDFPELSAMGLGEFMDMEANAITYKNTYYILPHIVDIKRTHFHELVHVAQWQQLGAEGFIARYIQEIKTFGYHNAPLEKMAYGLDSDYSNQSTKFDVVDCVKRETPTFK